MDSVSDRSFGFLQSPASIRSAPTELGGIPILEEGVTGIPSHLINYVMGCRMVQKGFVTGGFTTG